MKLVRKGCASCGKVTMALDADRASARLAVNRFARNPTTANRAKAERARDNLDAAKRIYAEHMARHEEETCARI